MIKTDPFGACWAVCVVLLSTERRHGLHDLQIGSNIFLLFIIIQCRNIENVLFWFFVCFLTCVCDLCACVYTRWRGGFRLTVSSEGLLLKSNITSLGIEVFEFKFELESCPSNNVHTANRDFFVSKPQPHQLLFHICHASRVSLCSIGTDLFQSPLALNKCYIHICS